MTERYAIRPETGNEVMPVTAALRPALSADRGANSAIAE
jgi:hypothetical protein